jgi:hypothetical protein
MTTKPLRGQPGNAGQFRTKPTAPEGDADLGAPDTTPDVRQTAIAARQAVIAADNAATTARTDYHAAVAAYFTDIEQALPEDVTRLGYFDHKKGEESAKFRTYDDDVTVSVAHPGRGLDIEGRNESNGRSASFETGEAFPDTEHVATEIADIVRKLTR